MKKKFLLTLDDEFIRYCEINKIENVDSLAKKIFNRGFTIEKYGETPTTVKGSERIVEREVVKEIIVEKIVEVIKEIEIIKEVPVEKIVEVIKEVPIKVKGETQIITKEVIKEIPVEKVMWDEEKENYLLSLKTENEKLKKELNDITVILEKMNKAKYLKGSDLNNLYEE
jgi:DNA-directed RNA polymerase beta' subunit